MICSQVFNAVTSLLLICIPANSHLVSGVRPLLAHHSAVETLAFQDVDSELQDYLDRNGQIHTVVLLDSILCLSVEQTEAVLEIVAEQWDSSWNAEMAAMTLRIWSHDRFEVIQSLDSERFKPILSKEQFRELERMEEIFTHDFQILLVKERAGEGDAYLEATKDVFERLMAMKMAEINRLCQMDKRQQKFLSVACKGAVSELMRDWKTTLEKYAKNPDDPATKDEAMRRVRETLASQCIAGKVWKKVLNKVFDDDQLAMIQKRETIRTQVASKQFLTDMVIFWTGNRVSLSRDQHTQVVEVLYDNLKLDNSWDMLGAEKQWAQLPDEKFKGLFSEKEWPRFRKVLTTLRRQWPND